MPKQGGEQIQHLAEGKATITSHQRMSSGMHDKKQDFVSSNAVSHMQVMTEDKLWRHDEFFIDKPRAI